MNRLGLTGLIASALVACSHPSPSPVTPLPPEKPAAPIVKADPPAPPPKPVAPEPPKPTAHDTDIPAAATTVKLLSPGKGKRVVAKIATIAGAKMPVELHIDFSATQDGKTQPTPTIILRGDATASTVDKDGTQFRIVVSSTDTRYAVGVKPVAQLESGLAGLVGMTITGTVSNNGTTDKIALHHDAVSEISGQLMDLFKVTWMPMWPVLPSEAIAPGAKWEVTSGFKLVGQLEVTEVLDYELVSVKDKTWTVKATAKLSGPEQTLEGSPVKGIAGTGAVDATFVDGQLIPTEHGQLSAEFSVTAPQGQVAQLGLTLGNDVSGVANLPTAAN